MVTYLHCSLVIQVSICIWYCMPEITSGIACNNLPVVIKRVVCFKIINSWLPHNPTNIKTHWWLPQHQVYKAVQWKSRTGHTICYQQTLSSPADRWSWLPCGLSVFINPKGNPADRWSWMQLYLCLSIPKAIWLMGGPRCSFICVYHSSKAIQPMA